MVDKITIASNCYYMDYQFVLSKKYLSDLLHSDNSIFDMRIMTVNDIDKNDTVESLLEERKADCKLSDYIFVSEACDGVMSYYEGCSRESFIQRYSFMKCLKYSIRNKKKFRREFDGYNYSLPVMTAMMKCKTRWFLWCDEDALFDDKNAQKWIQASIELMKRRPDILVANPLWNDEYDKAKKQSISDDDLFLYSDGFSIQCFLIDLHKILGNKKLYSEFNNQSELMYPIYGGNCFEKRINAFMRNNHFLRATYKHCSYYHESFTEEKIKKLLEGV